MKMKLIAVLLLLFCFMSIVSLAGAASAETEIIVSAAASLTNSFGEIAKKFESANPGIRVVPNFAASGALLQQIEKGAPADVFASADQKTMDQAAEKKLILPDTRKDFAGNEIVMIVPAASKLAIKSLNDVSRKEVEKISVGNPDIVPAGRYAKEALIGEGLWDVLTPRFIFGDSVRQVLDYVSRGEVDAGFVYATDAAIAKEKVKLIAEASKHQPIRYPIAIISSTKNREAAARFIGFVLSDEGQDILSRYGFKRPPVR